MNKISLLFFLIFFFISPLYFSNEKINNTSENINDTLNSTNETVTKVDNSPFHDFDFGNLIWLDDFNATSEIKKYDLLFIIFYSRWCKYCLDYFPEYILTSKYAEEKKLPVKFAKIDTFITTNITGEFDLRVIPTVFLIYKGKRYIFEGDITKDNLLKFMDRKINNDVYKYETLSEIKELVAKSPSLVLLSTLRDEQTLLYQYFLNYSKVAQDFQFISCITDECIKEYKEDIILFKKCDEKMNKYIEEYGNNITKTKRNIIKTFVGAYGFETGGILNQTQMNIMFEYRKNILIYFRNSYIEEYTKFDKKVKELGKELRKKNIYTAIADIEGDPFHEKIARTFIILKQDLPLFLYYDVSSKGGASIYTIKNANNEELNKDFIKDYINKIINGTVRKDLYSEPPLENYIINGLKYVIGRTFDKDVIEEKKNVMLAIIDGHLESPETNRVLDIMRNLSKKYNKEEKSIVFTYIDASKNQPRDININKEYPPLVMLYTNAMTEKKVIKMAHNNFTTITEDDVEDFLYEKLNWGKSPHAEIKEKAKKLEEKKEEKKQKENKNDTQTDL